MLNKELVTKFLNDIKEASQRARELLSKPFEDLNIYERLALRYLIIELVEASASLCVHLLRALYDVEVEGYPHCFLQMGRVGIIPRGPCPEACVGC